VFGGRIRECWADVRATTIAQSSSSHRHPINRLCHTLGIPLIALSVVLFVVTLFVPRSRLAIPQWPPAWRFTCC
jgi:hypothetical protein